MCKATSASARFEIDMLVPDLDSPPPLISINTYGPNRGALGSL